MLSAIVIDYILSQPSHDDIAVAFAFCNHKDPTAHDKSGLIACLAKHLAGRERSLPGPLHDLYKNLSAQNETRKPKWKDLPRLLLSISKRFRKIIVLIDALDECDDTDVRDVLSLLNELQGLPKTFVRLFVTSRSHATRSAEQAFKNAQPITMMNITATQSDLENFVRDNVETHPFLQSLSPALKEEIVSTTASEAQGRYGLTLFQYLSCVADSYFLTQVLNGSVTNGADTCCTDCQKRKKCHENHAESSSRHVFEDP